jgi:preprotein translocase subunit SecA
MLKRFIRVVGGDPTRRDIERYSERVAEINAWEPALEQLSDDALQAKTAEFRQRRTDGAELDSLLPEAFAVVREAARRTIGLRHYDVQMIGGMVLHEGRVAEMRTGEGKTLVATLPLYLNALEGRGAHLVTVNDYLARRDARWMGRIYHFLGLRVGVLQEAARTDNARKAFLFDPERQSTQEDANQLQMVDRREAYAADITYGTNHEFGFDYLRDNLTLRREERVQWVEGMHRRHYAIVDEVDNILIDEARTPLIISGPAAEDPQEYKHMAQVVRQLRTGDFEINERDRTVVLTEAGEIRAEEVLGVALRNPDRPEDVTPEQARLIGHLQQAMRAEYLFRRNKDYLVQGGQVIIVDEFTGRLMHGRRWSDGLHQAVEAKEGIEIQPENVTYATITLQNYFRLYAKLAGMTGTALTEAEEFNKIYKLDVVPVPTHLEFQARLADSGLSEVPYSEDGHRFFYFARKADLKVPVFWKRKDYKDVVFRTEEAKDRAVCAEILRMHALGRPVLVGTTSVERSENLSERLRAELLRKLVIVQLIRDAWFGKQQIEDDGRQVEEIKTINLPLRDLTQAQMRAAAKPLALSLNPEDDANLARWMEMHDLPDESRPRLLLAMQKGIAHQVLNAKKHAEESQIIAGAGAFGAVTIATNMAGRGVDIKLGGDLAEEILAAVNRVLRRSGVVDPFSITNAERLRVLAELPAETIGVYTAEVEFFRRHMSEEQNVRDLGGLHVLGSERHEARRIDNQLRGRAARQGDPGSSRFFLSLEDDLMRRFGGDQVAGMMQTLRIDDSMPLESGMVSRMIEQSQSRVEGSNFDIRKHLLEYDDVLNGQRAKVYEMRERIFEKAELIDDIRVMLQEEIERHVGMSEGDSDGPWKLLGWLEETQPSMRLSGDRLFPSFTVRVIRDAVQEASVDARAERIREVVGRALEEEENHLAAAFEQAVEQIVAKTQQTAREMRETLDTAWEGAEIEARESSQPVSAQSLINAAANATGIEAHDVSREIIKQGNLRELKQHLGDLAERAVWNRAAAQVTFWLERRTGLLPEKAADSSAEFDPVVDKTRARMESTLRDRHARILQEAEGQILAAASKRDDEDALARVLIELTFRTQMMFDPRTHQRRAVSMARFTWVYLAARMAAGDAARKSGQLASETQEHLLGALEALRADWGRVTALRYGDQALAEMPPVWRDSIRRALDENGFPAAPEDAPLAQWEPRAREAAERAIGGIVMAMAHRDLMLQNVGQAWVEYLTNMEALRTSIGLEAYAQRDPLVQYKSRAVDLYQQVLQQVRSGVVSRLFHMSLRNPTMEGGEEGVEEEAGGTEDSSGGRKKRKRH